MAVVDAFQDLVNSLPDVVYKIEEYRYENEQLISG
jgi:hypothetical protein